jgi:NAD(P)-dependent dehydrogenase (short-subunit alcohol dehydrogenase family)
VRETTLSGRTAVVTGGSRGIGYAIARALVDRDANVVIAGTHEGRLETAARELQRGKSNAAVEPVRADVRRYPDVESLMNTAAQRFGGIDILVNNAGVGVWRRVEDMSVAEWHEIVDTNLTGVFYCCRAALPHLKRRDSGWIVNISSLAAKNAFVDGAAYCASKSGLNAFSEALMQEVRHDGVRVAYVMPGSVRTGFSGHSQDNADWKLAPEDVAEVVIELISHPTRSLASRVELRPSRPPKKG